MKKIPLFAIIIAALWVITQSTGCKKVLDYIVHHPDGLASKCRIERIIGNYRTYLIDDSEEGVVVTDTAFFFYNAQGNPVRVEHPFSKADWRISSFDDAFGYDESGRLKASMEAVNPTENYADEWHYYTYVNSHLIIDTTFYYVNDDWRIKNRPEFYSYYRVSTIELDNFERIIKETDSGGFVTTYSYDQNGNLIKPGVTYTNKTSILQTNKVWMFLARDYSVNSPEGSATKYNQFKLPVKLNYLPSTWPQAVPTHPGISVNYQCN
ncbi:MAG TPA: RHS repeat protein [Agriterribacter sp.]|nr:RHS repeat protein [Agriterribacter sp.]